MIVERTLTGKCACGTVRYSITGPFRPIVACHCESCRRQSGHMVAATQVDTGNLTIHSGGDALTDWEATPGTRRRFCAVCGSLLFWEQDDSNRISVFAGSLDTPTGLTLAEHIYCAEKGDYYDIDPGVPAYATRLSD